VESRSTTCATANAASVNQPNFAMIKDVRPIKGINYVQELFILSIFKWRMVFNSMKKSS
jgi:hypothetical protein